MNWKTNVTVTKTAPVTNLQPVQPTGDALRAAAEIYAKRTDRFAEGKAAICLDMAAKRDRYGDFISEKQRDFALKLIEWSKPRNDNQQIQQRMPGLAVPKLFDVLQRHSTFYAGPLKLSRKNQDTLVWILYNDALVGKIEDGVATIWSTKAINAGVTTETVREKLEEFNADPLAAAMKYGKLSGRCCSCGRDLTDPASIEAGIGPICAEKFA